jgi:hypothetical protein
MQIVASNLVGLLLIQSIGQSVSQSVSQKFS